MKTKLLSLAILATLALPVSAQTYGGSSASQPSSPSSSDSGSTTRPAEQYGEGGSKHCDQLSGTEKQTCLQDEAAKTERKEDPSAAAPASSGATRQGDSSQGDSGNNATQTED